ncbi:MAG TPA: hypothetical protein VMT85_18600 [Thermoanaerobaculia bacterium]|nr:hypothetical protein [Thermoanaerobaculia bacterium]
MSHRRPSSLISAFAVLAVVGGAAAQQPPPEIAVAPEIAHAEVVRALTEARSFLPVGFTLEALNGTAVAVHRQNDSHPAQVVEQEGVPVLLLSERSYFADGGMIDLADAAIDTVAFLFEALFELHARRGRLGDLEHSAELEATAAQLYVDLPVELRHEALIDAQGQFVGHLASIASAVERSARRGADLCRRLETPLFGVWERTADTIEYLGTVWVDGRWLSSEVDLPPAQRRTLLADPLEGRWTGRVSEDFGRRYCP